MPTATATSICSSPPTSTSRSTTIATAADAELGLRSYCHPDVYGALRNLYYVNDGTGRFEERSIAAGFVSPDGTPGKDSKSLGVLASDFDDDGRPDVFVANDGAMNYLFLQKRRPDDSPKKDLLAGVGYNGRGRPEASMGIAYADVDSDGRSDLFVTHLDQETNTLYVRGNSGLWEDRTTRADLGTASLPWVGFGTAFADFDLDGDNDLIVTNGHIIDNIDRFDAERRHRQPVQLFFGDGSGRFTAATEAASGLGAIADLVGRGLATGDLDRDGDLDVVITQNDGPARVLVNTTDRPASAITVRLRGTRSNAPGFGARVTFERAGRASALTAEMLSSSSYLSQGAPEIVFGLGKDVQAKRLTIEWPSGGASETSDPVGGSLLTFTEGQAQPDLVRLGKTEVASPVRSLP